MAPGHGRSVVKGRESAADLIDAVTGELGW
jgi:hypothetical protein